MPKRAGIVLVVLGAVLMLSALLLFLYNRQESEQAGEYAGDALAVMESLLALEEAGASHGQGGPDNSGVLWDDPLAETILSGLNRGDGEEETDPVWDSDEMRVVTITGYGYIGWLEIPAIGSRLPIMDQWDAVRLKISPCRQVGSVYTDDLVVAGHNYDTFYARLGELRPGDEVIFMDMNGWIHEYQVTRMATLIPEAVDEVLHSGHDLVIYTCTVTAEERIVAFCDRVDDSVESAEAGSVDKNAQANGGGENE